jgi:hypothetical protein
VATNPKLSLPHEPITYLHIDFVNDLSLAGSRLCTKVDPGWAATIGITARPRLSNVLSIAHAQGGASLASYILDHPYSIAILSPVAIKTQVAELINQANISVAASPSTVAQAFLELAANGILPGGNGFDLSNAQSAYAWPM